NLEHFHGREPAEGGATRIDVAGPGGARCRRTFETKRCDVERSGEQTQYVVRPDPHAAVRRIRERLTQEEKPWPRAHARSNFANKTMRLLEKRRRTQYFSSGVKPLRSKSTPISASDTECCTPPIGPRAAR